MVYVESMVLFEREEKLGGMEWKRYIESLQLSFKDEKYLREAIMSMYND